jgi:hypothetical protein
MKLEAISNSRRYPSSRVLDRARCIGPGSTVDSSAWSASSQVQPVQPYISIQLAATAMPMEQITDSKAGDNN